jgi:hypothetical protein
LLATPLHHPRHRAKPFAFFVIPNLIWDPEPQRCTSYLDVAHLDPDFHQDDDEGMGSRLRVPTTFSSECRLRIRPFHAEDASRACHAKPLSADP